jgi:hypothetical protein
VDEELWEDRLLDLERERLLEEQQDRHRRPDHYSYVARFVGLVVPLARPHLRQVQSQGQ